MITDTQKFKRVEKGFSSFVLLQSPHDIISKTSVPRIKARHT